MFTEQTSERDEIASEKKGYRSQSFGRDDALSRVTDASAQARGRRKLEVGRVTRPSG